MKHISRILSLILSLSLLSTSAQAGKWKTNNGTSSRFELTLGGGYSKLGYTFQNNSRYSDLTAKSIGSWSAKAHIGYQFFFTRWMGIGLGANFQRYGGGILLNGQVHYNEVTDTDGEMYNHTLSLTSWKQQEQLYMVEIPLSLCFAIPVRDVLSITLELGGQYGIPVIANYKGTGETTHTAYYPQWHLTLHDQPDHGFYTESGFTPKDKIQHMTAWSLFGKLGVAIPVADQIELLVQAYGHYHLTTPIVVSDNQTLGFRNDREGMNGAHYFMKDYSSLATTGIAKTDPKPFSAGLEVGVRFIIPHKSTHCLCRWYDNGPVTWVK